MSESRLETLWHDELRTKYGTDRLEYAVDEKPTKQTIHLDTQKTPAPKYHEEMKKKIRERWGMTGFEMAGALGRRLEERTLEEHAIAVERQRTIDNQGKLRAYGGTTWQNDKVTVKKLWIVVSR